MRTIVGLGILIAHQILTEGLLREREDIVMNRTLTALASLATPPPRPPCPSAYTTLHEPGSLRGPCTLTGSGLQLSPRKIPFLPGPTC